MLRQIKGKLVNGVVEDGEDKKKYFTRSNKTKRIRQHYKKAISE